MGSELGGVSGVTAPSEIESADCLPGPSPALLLLHEVPSWLQLTGTVFLSTFFDFPGTSPNFTALLRSFFALLRSSFSLLRSSFALLRSSFSLL